VRAGFHGVTWVPVMSLILLLPFSRAHWWSAGLRVAGVMLSSIFCYFGWRATCAAYFAMPPGVMRVFMGVLAPHTLSFIGFEFFFLYAKKLQEHRGAGPAAVWLITPLCFGVSTAATLQQGASDITSGVVMEFLSMLFELNSKRSLLLGRTPLQESWFQAKRLMMRMRTRGAQVVPDEGNESGRKASTRSTMHNNVSEISILPVPSLQKVSPPSSAEELPAAMQVSSSFDLTGDASQDMQCSEPGTASMNAKSSVIHLAATQTPDTWSILVLTALYSNIVEMIVHASVAAVYILAKLNPNMGGDFPIPPARVLGLLGIKILFELCTDIIFAAWASQVCGESRSEVNTIEELWGTVSWLQLAFICVFAFTWGLDSQTTFVLYLCPYAMQDGAGLGGQASLLSLGLCPLSTFI